MTETAPLRWMPRVIASFDGRSRLAVDYGRLVVSERRDVSDSSQIELAVYRIPTRATQPGPPIVLLAGGPGDSGLNFLRQIFPVVSRLSEVADVIAFDQRGAGSSIPQLTSPISLALPLDETLDQQSFLAHYRARTSEAMNFWSSKGTDLRGYTTIENAHDVNALREGLRVEKISLFGASYGSHLGLATIREFGQHIDRAVLGLVEGPDHTIKLPSQIQHHLTDLDQLLQIDPYWRDRLVSISESLTGLAIKLDSSPVQEKLVLPELGETQVVIDGFDLRYVLAQLMGRHNATRLLPARLETLLRGNYEWLLQRSAAYRTAWLPLAMQQIMDSASGVSSERLRRIHAEAPGTAFGELVDFPFPYISQACGAPDLGEEFRSSIISNVPTLFISGGLDPRTPAANVHEIRPGFSRSNHIQINGMTHENPLTVPDVVEQVATFYKSGEAEDGFSRVDFHFAETT